MAVKKEWSPRIGDEGEGTELGFRFINFEMSMGHPSGNVQQVWISVWESPACICKQNYKSGWNRPGCVQRIHCPCFPLEDSSSGTEYGVQLGCNIDSVVPLGQWCTNTLTLFCFLDPANCHLLLLQSHQYFMTLSSFQADMGRCCLLDSINRCLDLDISHAHTPEWNEIKEKPFRCMLMPLRQLLWWRFLALLLAVEAVVLVLTLFLDYQNEILKPLSLCWFPPNSP